VNLTYQASDGEQHGVTDLTVDDFTVLEDGIEVSNGQLSPDCQKIEVELPSARWSVEYDSQKEEIL
jgi:hypothetical protein